MKLNPMISTFLVVIICLATDGSNAEDQPHVTGIKGGEMVLIPAGEFWMGCNKQLDKHCDDDEMPYHIVYLDAYYIDKYEVTNKQYNQCVRSGPCDRTGYYYSYGQKQPVVGVDWNQASTFCSWAGKRLPTEAEWEKAARGTDGRTYPWGEGIDCSRASYRECKHPKIKPVGSYPSGASPYGAMDMAGNSWEWVADWYDENFYRNSPNRNPRGPSSGKFRVLRGGSIYSISIELATRNRIHYWPDSSHGVFGAGFRCALDRPTAIE